MKDSRKDYRPSVRSHRGRFFFESHVGTVSLISFGNPEVSYGKAVFVKVVA